MSRGRPFEKSRNRNLFFGGASFACDDVVDALGVSVAVGLSETAGRVGIDCDERLLTVVAMLFFFLMFFMSRPM